MQSPSQTPVKKRQFDAAFKAQVVQQSYASSISVAALAQQHGIRDALIYKWRREMKLHHPSSVLAKTSSDRQHRG